MLQVIRGTQFWSVNQNRGVDGTMLQFTQTKIQNLSKLVVPEDINI